VTVFIDVDPNAPHDEDCGFWHGFACRCKPEMEKALHVHHCHECDFEHGSGYNRCNCHGFCICERLIEENCPCIGTVPVKPPSDGYYDAPNGDEIPFYRCDGKLICFDCWKPYNVHPSDEREECLTVLCNGWRVKL
jgi:hypothetical protein